MSPTEQQSAGLALGLAGVPRHVDEVHPISSDEQRHVRGALKCWVELVDRVFD